MDNREAYLATLLSHEGQMWDNIKNMFKRINLTLELHSNHMYYGFDWKDWGRIGYNCIMCRLETAVSDNPKEPEKEFKKYEHYAIKECQRLAKELKPKKRDLNDEDDTIEFTSKEVKGCDFYKDIAGDDTTNATIFLSYKNTYYEYFHDVFVKEVYNEITLFNERCTDIWNWFPDVMEYHNVEKLKKHIYSFIEHKLAPIFRLPKISIWITCPKDFPGKILLKDKKVWEWVSNKGNVPIPLPKK